MSYLLSTKKRRVRHISFKALIRGNKVSRSRWGTFFLLLFLFAGALIMALPMILIISNAFKPYDELLVFPPRLIPNNPTLKNFRDMFSILSSSYVPFLRFIFNSVFVTAAGTAGHIIISSMCAYPLAKKKFPGRNVIFNMIVFSLMFSATASVISNYIIMSSLHWIDTYYSGVWFIAGSLLDETVYGAAAGFFNRSGQNRRSEPMENFLADSNAKCKRRLAYIAYAVGAELMGHGC